MLEPSDLEALEAMIRRIVKEELNTAEREYEEERKRELSAERSKRYRERKRHATVTQNHANSEGAVTSTSRDRHAAPGESDSTKDSPPLLPLFPPHTPPITPSSRTSSNTHTKYARVPASREEVISFVTEKLKLTEEDAIVLWEHWVGNGFKVNGRPMNSWKHTASKWERCGFLYPSLQEKNKNQSNGYQKHR